MPVRISRLLPRVTADINSMTRFVESMAAHFGKELTLCYITKHPNLLNLDFDTVLKRCSSMQEMLGIRESDIPLMLRKCPQLLLVESHQLKAAYDHIPRVVSFTPALVGSLHPRACHCALWCLATLVWLAGRLDHPIPPQLLIATKLLCLMLAVCCCAFRASCCASPRALTRVLLMCITNLNVMACVYLSARCAGW
jgi:hypothetical protein